MNYDNWIIGAGVGCRLQSHKKDCYIDLLGVDRSSPSSKAAKLDQNDHEILGALQLVAKALDVWFGAIATSLLYDLTILLGRQCTGLPVTYLLTHVEFGDISILFSSTLWRSSGIFHRRYQRSLLLFAALVALLSVVCNLMGPATAVLVIPTLGWVDKPVSGADKLGKIAAAEAPSNPAIATSCSAISLANGDYICTDYYLPELDVISSSIVYSLQEYYQHGYGLDTGIFREAGLSFAINFTANSTAWAPNRQVIREISLDYVEFQATQVANRTFEEAKSLAAAWNRTLHRDLYDSYRNVLDVSLFRQGPVLGTALTNCARGNATDILVSKTKSVRCYYFDWSIDKLYNRYQCVRVGLGWHVSSLADSHFRISHGDGLSSLNVTVGIYAEDESILLREEAYSCLSRLENSQSCDWDTMFAHDSSSAEINLVGSQQYVEYVLAQSNSLDATVICYGNTYSTTAPYNIDISPTSNSLGLVSLVLPSSEQLLNQPSIALHPDWILAGWSVPRFGTRDADSAATKNLVTALQRVASTGPPETLLDDDPSIVTFSNLHMGSMTHALTLVDFTTLPAASGLMGDTDTSNVPLTVSRRLRVWAYGHSSHTFKVGMVVVTFGAVCVFARVVLGFYIVSKHRSTHNFLSAALRYSPQTDDIEMISTKATMSHVSVRVVENDHHGLDFVQPQGHMRYRSIRESV